MSQGDREQMVDEERPVLLVPAVIPISYQVKILSMLSPCLLGDLRSGDCERVPAYADGIKVRFA